jgi:hypothetical protein
LNLIFTALLMLCGLGTAILATTAATKFEAAAMAIGFAVVSAFTVSTGMLPDAASTGVVVAIVAALRVFRPKVRFLAPICAGALAAVCGSLLQGQGWPAAAALALAGVVMIAPAVCAARLPSFAPDGLRDEALLVAAALGLTVAMIPEITAGWHSALVLNHEQQDSANQVIANWVLVLSAASVALGGLYSLLRRR